MLTQSSFNIMALILADNSGAACFGFLVLLVFLAWIYGMGYQEGKRIGSRKGYGVGFERGRRSSGCVIVLIFLLAWAVITSVTFAAFLRL